MESCLLLEAVRAGGYWLVRDVHLSIDEQLIPSLCVLNVIYIFALP